MKTALHSLLIVTLVLLAGCGDKHSSDDGHDHGTESTKGAQHGKPGAVPGSHEDWCAEHGLPESQCLKCNPDLKIERPPQQAGGQR